MSRNKRGWHNIMSTLAMQPECHITTVPNLNPGTIAWSSCGKHIKAYTDSEHVPYTKSNCFMQPIPDSFSDAYLNSWIPMSNPCDKIRLVPESTSRHFSGWLSQRICAVESLWRTKRVEELTQGQTCTELPFIVSPPRTSMHSSGLEAMCIWPIRLPSSAVPAWVAPYLKQMEPGDTAVSSIPPGLVQTKQAPVGLNSIPLQPGDPTQSALHFAKVPPYRWTSLKCSVELSQGLAPLQARSFPPSADVNGSCR